MNCYGLWKHAAKLLTSIEKAVTFVSDPKLDLK